MPNIEITNEMVARASAPLRGPRYGILEAANLARRVLEAAFLSPAPLTVEPVDGKRWRAFLTYNSANGPVLVEYDFDEWGELERIVERGPDWNTLADISITLRRRTRPEGDTVEEAAER